MKRAVRIVVLLFLISFTFNYLSAQTDAHGKPAGFVRLSVTGSSQKLSSIPFTPFNNALNSIFEGQLTGEDNDDSADKVVKWDVTNQQYESAFKADNTGDSNKDGKWFEDDVNWNATTLTLSPGEGFWVQNQHASAQTIFLMGNVVLDDSKSVTLYQNMNLFAFPFTSRININSTDLKNDGAHGAATQNNSPDVLSKVNPDADYWLLDDSSDPNDGKWLDSNNALVNDYLKAGLGYWYNRALTTSFTWTEQRPYQNPFSNVSTNAPEITSMSVNSTLDAITLNISCSGTSGEELEILFKDVAVDECLVTESGWSIAATGIATNSNTSITWTDSGNSSPTYPEVSRDAVTSPYMRIYLVIRSDIDSDSDGLPDARESFVHGSNSTSSDTDSDGMPDWWEVQYGLDPTTNDASGDADSDGLSNLEEYCSNGMDSYTKFLMSCEGANGSTVFADGTGNHTITTVGDTQIDTSAAKFGSGSGLFDGNGDYLSVPDSDDFDFGTGDFTIDFWFYDNGTSVSYPNIIGNEGAPGWGSGDFSVRYYPSSSKFSIAWNDEGNLASVNTFASNVWHHVEVSREGSTLRLFVNGNLENSMTVSSSLDISKDSTMRIGGGNWDGANSYIKGRVDEIRISKGIARHTSNFTPSTYSYSFGTNTNPSNSDTDNDGMPDGWEVQYGLDPLNASDASEDPDHDGSNNLLEYQNGYNPFVQDGLDSDSDGMPDVWENSNGLNPNSDDASSDADSDGLTNLQEYSTTFTLPSDADTDNDNLNDGNEVNVYNTNPLVADTDADGLNDGAEVTAGYNPTVYTQILYVDDSQTDDTGDGLTLANAKKTISAAISTVSTDGNEHVILVAAGTYTGASNRDLNFASKEIKLSSISGAETTIIDCESTSCAFNMSGAWGDDSWIDGFTVKNGSYTDGGAIRLGTSLTITIKNCVISDNVSSASAGACWVYYSSPKFVNCEFKNNSSSSYGGALCASGASANFEDCRFIGNSTTSSGGAVTLFGGTNTFENCKFEKNSAVTYYGGAMSIANSATASINNCRFEENVANHGGGISISNATEANVTNSLFLLNEALYQSGAIRTNSNTNLTNVTIFNNSAGSGSYPGIYIDSTPVVNATNCIIWNEISTGSSTFNINYSCAKDDFTSSGTGNLNIDPQLTPSGWLTSSSPCIDTGTSTGAPSADINGLSRPAGSGIDMGCDEYRDSDSDALPDWFETAYGGGSDLTATGDTDSDGLTNLQEFSMGLNAASSDTDEDGIDDAIECNTGYDPLVYTKVFYVDNSQADDTGDGLTLATAKKSIGAAISAVSNSDGNEHVIMVAAGTYTGTNNKNLEFYGKQIKLRSISGAATTIIDCEDTDDAFYIHAGEDSNSWIDGFTIKNGNNTNGGAIAMPGASITIKNCIFDSNYAASGGGAVWAFQCSPIFENCTFTMNSSGGYGGAIHSTGTASDGSTFKNCSFIDNNTVSSGAAISICGYNSDVIEDCLFENNATTNFGGALYVWNNASATISRTIFKGSLGNNGGAICFGTPTNVNITNTLFTLNEAIDKGGAIEHNAGTGAITLTNTTIYSNKASTASGIWITTTTPTYDIKNSIIWDGIISGSSTFTVNYSDTQDDYTGVGTGNLNIDPQLTPSGWLTSSSPCIDAGTSTGAPADDINGLARPVGSGIDMGCDEYSDSDSDGLPDWFETAYGGGADLTAEGDADSDGLTNLQEFSLGLNPSNSDTDGDNVDDATEYNTGYDPLVYTQILYVEDNQPDDTGDGLTLATAKKSIGAAIGAVSNDGNEHVIMVAAGTYTGSDNKNLDFDGLQIKLRSIDGAATTIIDCEDSGRAFYIHSGEIDSWIDGFTIKNGNESYGSGIYFAGSLSLVVKNCKFDSNSGDYGVAIYAYSSPVHIASCEFVNNSGRRGAALNFSGESHVIDNCNFENNSASDYGSGVYLYATNDTFTNCVFKENIATFYGTIYSKNGTANFIKCEFAGNSNQNGGVFWIESSDVLLKNSLLVNNSATYTGGAIRNQSGSGAITIENTTIAFNTAPSGGDGIWVGTSTPTINIKNSIIWDNIISGSATINVNYSDTMDDYTGVGTGNLNVDPLLTSDGWFNSNSPCIDTGTSTDAPSDDIHSLSRPAGNGIDMGCDEYRDSDSDGVADWYEIANGMNPNSSDSDSDGMPDGWEVQYGLDPTTNDASGDLDSDGLTNLEEYNLSDGYTKLLLHCDGADGSTTFTDETGNHTITANGDAQIDTADKKFGTASGLFDGNDDYLTFPNSEDFDFGSDNFTIDFWFKPTAESRMGLLAGTSDKWFAIDYHYQGTRNINIWASSSNTAWDLLNGNPGGNAIGSISLNLNAWNHVAIVRNGNNWMSFINGIKDIDVTVSGTISNINEAKRIGKWGSSIGYYLAGHLDEYRISKGVARWTENFTPPQFAYSSDGMDPSDSDSDNDGMPDGWEVQYGLDPTVNDASGDLDNDGLSNLYEYQNSLDPTDFDSDNDGMPDGWEVQYGLDPTTDDASGDLDSDGLTNLEEYSPIDSYTKFLMHSDGTDGSTSFTDIVGNHTITANGDAQVSTAYKKFGTASVLFDGNGDYLSVAGSEDFNFGTGDFTIDFWFYDNGTSTLYPNIIGNEGGSGWSSGDFSIRYNNTGSSYKFMVVWNDEESLVSTNSFYSNTWHHVEVSREDFTLRLFVNGNLESSTTVSAALDLSSDSTLRIGGGNWDGSNSYIVGRVDEIRISKGIARHNSNFIPYIAPYRNTGTDPSDSDSDDDGMPDGWEAQHGLDPNVDDTSGDIDGDGLSNLYEYQNNIDPSNTDSDDDGMPDGWEVQYGLDPSDASDASGDLDSDGLTNLEEYEFGRSELLLVHFDGNNASTTFAEATGNHALTPYGNAQIDTTYSKFGTASGLLDGNGDYLTAEPHDDFKFGTGDFTVEAWIRPAGYTESYGEETFPIAALGDYFGQGAYARIAWYFEYSKTGSHFRFYTKPGDGLSSPDLYCAVSDPVNLNLNEWVHVAVVRNAGKLYFFLNGSRINAADISFPYDLNVELPLYNNLFIGRKSGGLYHNAFWYANGHIDELRISKGSARWTANFTLPSSPYSVNSSDPTDTDSDDDGMPDGWEADNGLDPVFDDSLGDLDNDGLNNLAEYTNGTNPNDADSDGDGMSDGWEVQYGLNPANASDATGDLDGDGLTNLEEYTTGRLGALFHFDGLDGAASFIEETGKMITPYGNAQIDTTYSKFGTASGLLDGNGDYLTAEPHDDFKFGTGDFTVEAWIRPAGYTESYGEETFPIASLGNYFSDGSDARISWYFEYSNTESKLRFFTKPGDSPSSEPDIYCMASDPINVNLNEWAHVAVVRNAGKLYFFLNGSRVNAADISFPYDLDMTIPVDNNLFIGRKAGGLYHNVFWYANGHIDELRISKGSARWTANFTLPSSPYSVNSSDPTDTDSDDDGMPDGWEADNGLDPVVDDSLGDLDNDGLNNLGEYTNGTNPNDADSDDDGMSDGWEVQYGLNPNLDDANSDADSDGLNNLEEFQLGGTGALFHFDGIQGSVGFIEETGKTITHYGNAYLNTGVKKFGTASTLLDGDGDHLTAEPHDDFKFGTGDFTLEAWIRPIGFSELHGEETFPIVSLGNYFSNGSDARISWYFEYSNTESKLRFYTKPGDGLSSPDLYCASSDVLTVPMNAWNHVAVVRCEGKLYFFLNGIKVNSEIINFPYDLDMSIPVDDNLFIGRKAGGLYHNVFWYANGYIDELRISKGIARWTSDFTLPTASYSLSSSNPANSDTDGDGMPDGWEVQYGLDPVVDDASGDLDNDGLNNLGEYTNGANPNDTDSDDDGFSDYWEVNHTGFDPNDPSDASKDTDGDGMPDAWEIIYGLDYTVNDASGDLDGDGLSNIQEYNYNAPKLLLHCDGTDGSSVFLDASGNSHAITANGNAQVDTEKKRFGSGSVLFDGNGDYLEITDSDDWDFSNSDVTIDFRLCMDSLPEDEISIIMGQSSVANDQNWMIYIYPDGSVAVGRNGISELKTPISSIQAGQWNHIAITKDASVTTVYINGQALSSTTADIWNNASTPLRIGSGSPGYKEFAGYLDEIRISKGIVRWEKDFMLPSSPYPTSMSRLNPNDSDSDDDGLSDYVEVNTYGTDPWVADTDGDGLSDGYEANTSLTDPLDSDSDNDGVLDGEEDNDSDGLTNSEEESYGTNSNSSDTDSDGVSDYVEIKESLTDATSADFGTLSTLLTLDGSAESNTGGSWTDEGTTIYANDRNGWLEYSLNITTAGVYRLEITGTQRLSTSSQDEFVLDAYIDGMYCCSGTLKAAYGTTGAVYFYLPELSVATHTLKIVWNNIESGTKLQINSIKLDTFGGPDSDSNGRADWIDNRLSNLASDLTVPATSKVSPVCIEGGNAYCTEEMSISGYYTPSGETPVDPVIKLAPSNRWYADVPIDPDASTNLTISYQNGAKTVQKTVTWETTNVLTDDSYIEVRQNDSLKLTAYPEGATDGSISITVEGTTYNPTISSPVVHKFETAGSVTVTAVYTPTVGEPITKTATVRVCRAVFSSAPACVVGYWRSWENPNIGEEAVLEYDSNLSVKETALSSGRKIDMLTNVDNDSYMIAHLGPKGPIMDSVKLYTITYTTHGAEGYYKLLETYTDGSMLIEGYIYLSEVPSDISIVLTIFAAGITFEGGTTEITLTAEDFDENGVARYRLIKPPGAATATCHHIRIYQGTEYINTIDNY